MKFSIFLIVMTYLLLGCLPTSLKELKSTAKFKKTLYFDLSYQKTYKILSTKIKECHQFTYGFISSGSSIVDSQLYPDMKSAEIIWYFSTLNVQYVVLIEIEEYNKNSKINAFIAFNRDGRKFIDKLIYWMDGGEKCDRPKDTKIIEY